MNSQQEIKKYIEEIQCESTPAYKFEGDQDFSVAQSSSGMYVKENRCRISLEKALFENTDNPLKTKEIMSKIDWGMPLLLNPVLHHEGYTQVSEESPKVMSILVSVLRSENQHAIEFIPMDKKLGFFEINIKNSSFLGEVKNMEDIEKLSGLFSIPDAALRNASSSFLVFAENPNDSLLNYWLSKLKVQKDQKNGMVSELNPLINKMKPQVVKRICEKALMDNQVFELILPCARSLLRCGYFSEFAELITFANQNLEKEQLCEQIGLPKGAQMEPWIEIITAHKKVGESKDEYILKKWDEMLQIIPSLHGNGNIATFIHLVRNDKEKLWAIRPSPGEIGFACMALDFKINSALLYDAERDKKDLLFKSREELAGFLRQCIKSYIEKELPKIDTHEKAWRLESKKEELPVLMANLGQLWSDCAQSHLLSNEESKFSERKAMVDLVSLDLNQELREKRQQLARSILPVFNDAMLNNDLLQNVKPVTPSSVVSPPQGINRF